MKLRKFQLKSFVMKNGERYSVIVSKTNQTPLFYPNLYVTTQVRNKSNSLASMETALSGIKVLLSFCDERGIDLSERFLKREFFNQGEMDSIRDYCQVGFGSESINAQTTNVSPIKVRKATKKPTRKVGLASEYIRLSYIAKYVEWLATILLEGGAEHKTMLEISKMKKGFESRRPTFKNRNQEGVEKGLTHQQETKLLELIRPGFSLNPFEKEATQVRNEVIILLLHFLGIRSGELLNLKVSDVDWAKNQIVIARRPDEKEDSRRRQPLVKTRDRRIPVKETLIQAMHNYVINYRRKVPGANKCEYLLVTHKAGPTQGQPISRSTLVKVIDMVAAAESSLSDLHAHELRHTWNHRYSEYMDKMKDAPSPDEQEMQRSYLQGWKPGSGTAAIYTKRFTREKAIQAGLKLQDGIMRKPESFNDE